MKRALLAALLAILVGTGTAFAACDSRTETCFRNISVSGTTELDGATTVGGTLAVTGASTLSGALTTTGVITTSASTPYAIAIDSVTAVVPTGTPTRAGLIAFSTTYVMYVSTGTGPGAWVKVGGQ